MKVVITLPDIQALSRNMTNGKFWEYSKQIETAQKWMAVYGKRYEHHFTSQVDVTILAYYDTRGRKNAADSPNIDDKIFTDILNRYRLSRKLGKIEQSPWFIEDDSPKYLRNVIKRSIPSDGYQVILVIEEVEAGFDDVKRLIATTT